MDPQRQRQFVNAMFANSAKPEDELVKMTDEERKEYLRARLHQKMFISGASRQSQFQKKQMQEKMQKKMEEEQAVAEEKRKKNAEKNKKKRDKKKAKKLAEKNEVENVDVNGDDEQVVMVEKDGESDYESDSDN